MIFSRKIYELDYDEEMNAIYRMGSIFYFGQHIVKFRPFRIEAFFLHSILVHIDLFMSIRNAPDIINIFLLSFFFSVTMCVSFYLLALLLRPVWNRTDLTCPEHTVHLTLIVGF